MKKGICDVCFYVDNDATIKDVEYCETCNAYICDKCRPNLFRRGLAAMKRFRLTKDNKPLLSIIFPNIYIQFETELGTFIGWDERNYYEIDAARKEKRILKGDLNAYMIQNMFK